jgi:hypothetical protein
MVKLARDVTIAAAAVTVLVMAFSAIVQLAPAAAQTAPVTGNSGAGNPGAGKPVAVMRRACADDVQRLCPGVMPGGGRIQKCFVEKYAEVSAACRSAMEEARAMKAGGTN